MTGLQLIEAERARQKAEEGWTKEHDDKHVLFELENAAICYYKCGENPSFAIEVLQGTSLPCWPWDWSWFKPFDRNHRGHFPQVDRLRCFVKAGALAMAEEDRLTRQKYDTAVLQSEVHDLVLAAAAEIDKLNPAKQLPQTRYAYSLDEERYHGNFASEADAFFEVTTEHPGCRFWIGECVPPTQPEDYWHTEDWLEHVSCQDSYSTEWSEGWDHSTPEQRAELESLIRPVLAEWLDRHGLRPTFFEIGDVTEYAADGTPKANYKAAE